MGVESFPVSDLVPAYKPKCPVMVPHGTGEVMDLIGIESSDEWLDGVGLCRWEMFDEESKTWKMMTKQIPLMTLAYVVHVIPRGLCKGVVVHGDDSDGTKE